MKVDNYGMVSLMLGFFLSWCPTPNIWLGFLLALVIAFVVLIILPPFVRAPMLVVTKEEPENKEI